MIQFSTKKVYNKTIKIVLFSLIGGVQIRQPKEIVLGDVELQEEDKAVLKEILERRRGNGYIAYDIGFNERLEQLAKRLLGEEK
ncbi:hypothetical protein ACIQHV_32330 [Bacillus bombysepticus]|uniref:hypothetical protein n=1 Tax=Bacillus cereus group TaxID=86661 RepID=UPI0020CE28DA|nr:MULTISPECIES: hypothetical protein [Bacillus cereus group]MEC2869553.1 hypothetical protein [Bacillus cereus]